MSKLSESDAAAYHYPHVVLSLKGGLLSIEYKTEGCVVYLRDYDAMDPDQDPEDLKERRTTCNVQEDANGKEYQHTLWGLLEEVNP